MPAPGLKRAAATLQTFGESVRNMGLKLATQGLLDCSTATFPSRPFRAWPCGWVGPQSMVSTVRKRALFVIICS